MIYLAQLLCPARHCQVAVPFGDSGEAFEVVTQRLEEFIFGSKVLNRRCGICGSEQLHWEKLETPFQTIKEALPVLKLGEAIQLANRAQMDKLGMTHDVRQIRNN